MGMWTVGTRPREAMRTLLLHSTPRALREGIAGTNGDHGTAQVAVGGVGRSGIPIRRPSHAVFDRVGSRWGRARGERKTRIRSSESAVGSAVHARPQLNESSVRSLSALCLRD